MPSFSGDNISSLSSLSVSWPTSRGICTLNTRWPVVLTGFFYQGCNLASAILVRWVVRGVPKTWKLTFTEFTGPFARHQANSGMASCRPLHSVTGCDSPRRGHSRMGTLTTPRQGDLPTAVSQAITSSAPFNGIVDENLAIAYVASTSMTTALFPQKDTDRQLLTPSLYPRRVHQHVSATRTHDGQDGLHINN